MLLSDSIRFYFSIKLTIIVLAFLTIFLNGSVIIAFGVANRKLQGKRHFILVLLLAVSDAIFGIVTLILTFYLFVERPEKNLCLILAFVWLTTFGVSMSNVFIISLERFFATVNRTNLLKKKVFGAISFSTWTVTFGISITSILLSGTIRKPECKTSFLLLCKGEYAVGFWVEFLATLFQIATVVLYIIQIIKLRSKGKILPREDSFNDGTFRNRVGTIPSPPTLVNTISADDSFHSNRPPNIFIYRDSVSSMEQKPWSLTQAKRLQSRDKITRKQLKGLNEEYSNDVTVKVEITLGNISNSISESSCRINQEQKNKTNSSRHILTGEQKLFESSKSDRKPKTLLTTPKKMQSFNFGPTSNSHNIGNDKEQGPTTHLKKEHAIQDRNFLGISNNDGKGMDTLRPFIDTTGDSTCTSSLRSLGQCTSSQVQQVTPLRRRAWRRHIILRLVAFILFEITCFICFVAAPTTSLIFSHRNPEIEIVFIGMVLLHSIGNPILYAWGSPQFRKLTRKCMKNYET